MFNQYEKRQRPVMHRDRGVAMLVVLVVVAMATVLGTAFLAAQTTTTGITKNLEDQAVARQIAESGLLLIQNKIKNDPTWRTGRTQGVWVNNQSLGQGTFTAEISDADGDPSNNPEDPFVLTVTGKFGNVTHVVRSNVLAFGGEQSGLLAEYFRHGSSVSRLSDIDWDATPDYTETVPNVERENGNSSVEAYPGGPTGRWGSRYSGYIDIPTSGLWTFYTSSDDGSDLTIDGNKIVNNDGLHGWRTRSSTVTLDKGRFPFEARLFENGGWKGVVAYWQGPGVSKEVIPASAFSQSSGEGASGGATDSDEVSIAVKSIILMYGDSRIDAYSSSKGAYGGSNQTSNARVSTNGILPTLGVTMSDNATIEGKLMIKPLLALLPVVRWGQSEITDGLGYLPSEVDIEDVSMPSSQPANSGSLSIWGGSLEPITQDTRYSSISLGGNTQMTVQGDVTIICTGDFSMGGTSQLIITPGSMLKLYIGGSMSSYGSPSINAATDDPGRLELYMTGNNKNIQLSNSVKLSAYVQNPKGRLKLYSTSEFFGKYFGETLEMSGSPKIHADNSTGEEASEETATAYLFAWDEGL